jgi:hypothetical protein
MLYLTELWGQKNSKAPPIKIDNRGGYEQDRRMKSVPGLGRILLVGALPFCTTTAMGDGGDVSEPRPLIQVDFNRLVPITYPLVTTRFNTLKPTAYPVSETGVARVHTTENLIRPIDKPLLKVYQYGSKD